MLRTLLLLGCAASVLGTGFLPDLPEEVLAKLQFKSPPGADPTQCVDTNLAHCQVIFNTALGINTELDWHKPYYLHYALQNIYQTYQQQGVINVCSAYTQFVQCMGKEYYNCINPLYFLSKNYDITSSYVYPAIFANIHFQCGGGLETLLGSFTCINTGMNAYNTTIQGCIATYHLQMAKDPTQGCKYGLQLIQCVRAPFAQRPNGLGCNAPSSWYECEYTRVGIAIHLPYCDPNQFRCLVGSSSEPQESVHLDKKAAFEDAMKTLGAASHGVFQGIAMKELEKKTAQAPAKATL